MRQSLKRNINIICSWLWFLYIFAVLWLTFFNREPRNIRYELIPFWEYTYLFTGTSYERRYYFQQIRDNILLFVPYGFMLPTIFKRTFKATFLTALLFSVSIELLQLITARGLCEFDDVFNNTLGAVIGYLLYKSFYTALKSRKINKFQKGDV